MIRVTRLIHRRGLATSITMGLIGLALTTVSPSPVRVTEAAAQLCQTFEAWSPTPGADSRLALVDLPSGVSTPLGVAHHQIVAVGYASDQDLIYGMSDQADVVTIDRDGRDHDLGPVRDDHHRVDPALSAELSGAVAGAALGDRFYLRAGDSLYTLDIDPASPNYLGVVRTVPLDPAELGRSVDGFDVDPATGLLYSVVVTTIWAGEVVTIDPDTGRIRPLFITVPAGVEYGEVTLGPDHALYARNDNVDQHSALYRVPLENSAPATLIDTGPIRAFSDMTGCLPPARPRHAEAVPVPLPAVPPPPTTPQPIPEIPAVTPSKDEKKAQRQWALAVLVLSLGAGAAAGQVRAHRSR